MNFFFDKPSEIYLIHSMDWRNYSPENHSLHLCVKPVFAPGKRKARYTNLPAPGEILAAVEFTPNQELPTDTSLLLHLPALPRDGKTDSLFRINGGPWNWQWPILEVMAPVKKIELLNYPVPQQPNDVFFESLLRVQEKSFERLEECGFPVGDAPPERLELRLSSNFTGGRVRYSVTAEQPEAQRFMADRSFNESVAFEIAGQKVSRQMNSGVATGSIPLMDGTIAGKSFYLGNTFESNVVDPGFASDLGCQLLWGDLHVHSRESDGEGNAEDIVVRARDWQKLDFMAFNEHIEHDCTWRVWTPEKWQKLKALYDNSTQNGEFVIIPGFEYHSFCNLWCFSEAYLDSLHPEINCDEAHMFVNLSHPAEFAAQEVLVRQRIAQWAADPDWLVGYHRLELLKEQQGCLPPAVQLLQMAHYKRPPEEGSADYLIRGDRSAFFGSTDTHLGMPGVGFKGGHESRSGLTAVYASELSRNGLHKALRARHTYATMGSRTLFDVRLNDAIMGDEVKVADGESIELTIRALSKERIASLDIVSGGRDVGHWDAGGAKYIDHTWKSVKTGNKDAYYFVRMHLEDGRMLWSSPIWCIV